VTNEERNVKYVSSDMKMLNSAQRKENISKALSYLLQILDVVSPPQMKNGFF